MKLEIICDIDIEKTVTGPKKGVFIDNHNVIELGLTKTLEKKIKMTENYEYNLV